MAGTLSKVENDVGVIDNCPTRAILQGEEHGCAVGKFALALHVPRVDVELKYQASRARVDDDFSLEKKLIKWRGREQDMGGENCMYRQFQLLEEEES